jgi:hypothetical protein
MLAKCRDGYLHIGIERQRAENIVKLGRALDFEDADVCVLACHSPQMQPFARSLQLGSVLVFLFSQPLEHVGICARRYMDRDIHMKKHSSGPLEFAASLALFFIVHDNQHV